MLNSTHQTTYALATNPTEGISAKNANPSKYGECAIITRVLSLFTKAKYAIVCTCIALLFTVMVTFSPRKAEVRYV